MIGIFGGSGFYELLEKSSEVEIKTPYGFPSDKVTIGEFAGKRVAFLPRHGKNHKFAPHTIPYRANIWAMKELGATKIFGPCAAGSLQEEVRPGDFVICDSFVDRTHGRQDTFFELDDIRHVSSAKPYCSKLRSIAMESAEELGITAHNGGTVVVINGPRFASVAESRWYTNCGFSVINMTGYPEVILANELGVCYINISLITDYDCGLEGNGGKKASNVNEIFETFKKNNEQVKKMIFKMIEKVEDKPCFACHQKAEQAKIK